MCGINGFNFQDGDRIQEMNNKLKHRGPDGDGFFVYKGVSFGHTRLSIIDITKAGSQPMFYSKERAGCSKEYKSKNIETSNLAITYNGEIYNYLEVKKELETFGYKFSTNSDTEVILASYDMWGQDCVAKFNGMWAFCIYNRGEDTLFLSRDRLGVKPLYYFNEGDSFIFSSELKSIVSHEELKINRKGNISRKALEFYLYNDFIPSPLTIYENVSKLEPGTNITFNLKTKRLTKQKYYELPKYRPILNKKSSVSEVKKLLKDSTDLRMRSDVEVGAFLSGGVDSTTIVSEMKRNGEIVNPDAVHTFSIGFDGKYDETEYIKIANNSIKTKHHHKYFDREDFEKISRKISDIYDEPFGSGSGFPTYLVSKKAKEHITVCLSGDGGDEVFGGYNLHGIGRKMDIIYSIPRPLRILVSKIPTGPIKGRYGLSALKKAFKVSLDPKYLFFENIKDWYLYSPESVIAWKTDKLKECLGICNNNLCEALRVFDLLYGRLGDNFVTKVDRASMAVGLEVRSPFLDYRFAELSQKIPSRLKLKFSSQKYILKKSTRKDVPNEILYRKKQGFTPPVLDWINDEEFSAEINNGLSFTSEMLPEFHNIFLEKIEQGKSQEVSPYKLRLYIFSLWYKRWIVE